MSPSSVEARVAALLADVPIEDRLRGREVSEAAMLLGFSEPQTYRLISDGRLSHVKLEGKRRKGHGRAGAVRVRLYDVVLFQVKNEHTSSRKEIDVKQPSSDPTSVMPARGPGNPLPVQPQKPAPLPAPAYKPEPTRPSNLPPQNPTRPHQTPGHLS